MKSFENCNIWYELIIELIVQFPNKQYFFLYIAYDYKYNLLIQGPTVFIMIRLKYEYARFCRFHFKNLKKLILRFVYDKLFFYYAEGICFDGDILL